MAWPATVASRPRPTARRVKIRVVGGRERSRDTAHGRQYYTRTHRHRGRTQGLGVARLRGVAMSIELSGGAGLISIGWSTDSRGHRPSSRELTSHLLSGCCFHAKTRHRHCSRDPAAPLFFLRIESSTTGDGDSVHTSSLIILISVSRQHPFTPVLVLLLPLGGRVKRK